MNRLRIALVLALTVLASLAVPAAPRSGFPFRVQIKGSGKPVFLMHDLACAGEVWDHTVAELSKSCQCHIFTFAGNSAEQPVDPEFPYLGSLQEGVLRYMRVNAIKDVTIIGHGMGGLLGIMLASSEPTLFSRIIIIDAFPFFPAALNPIVTKEQATQQADYTKAKMITATDSAYRSDQMEVLKNGITNADQVRSAFMWFIQSDRYTFIQAMYEMATTDLRENLAKITCPVTVLGSWTGHKDFGATKEIMLINFRTQYSKARKCKIIMAETARHFIMLDDPKWFIEQVKKSMK